MKSKKTWLILLLCAVMAAAFCGCGGSDSGSGDGSAAESGDAADSGDSIIYETEYTGDGIDPASLKTLGDVYAVETDNYMSTFDESTYVYVFVANDGTPYRVIAKLTPEKGKEINGFDVMADDHDDQVRAALTDVEVDTVEDLSADMLTKEDRDALVGKTGQELLDDGFENVGAFILDETGTAYTMTKGLIDYNIEFNEVMSAEELGDEYDENEILKGLTVKRVVFLGPSNNALNLEEL